MNRHERETYDAALDGDPPDPCMVCTGDPDAAPCSPECEDIALLVARRRHSARLYQACRRALRIAAVYRMQGGPDDPRLEPLLNQVNEWRRTIMILRVLTWRDVDAILDVALDEEDTDDEAY